MKTSGKQQVAWYTTWLA